ncbi:MAG: nucleotide sugar dehydrogenase [Oryzihumus sp.]
MPRCGTAPDGRIGMNTVAATGADGGQVKARAANAQDPASPEFSYDVAIVGLGEVGLPTALAFYAAGHRVLGVDSSPRRVEAIRQLDVDVLPSDEERLRTALSEEPTLGLSTTASELEKAQAVLVCVPIPVDAQRVPDLLALGAACATVVAHARPGQTLILASTTYVGCTKDLLAKPLSSRGLSVGRDVYVAFSAERIGPGREFAHEAFPRVVGGVTKACADKATSLLSGYAESVHQVGSAEAAELTRLFEDSFRAVNVALANEFAAISGALHLDVAEVIAAAATKPYGFMAFSPGPGVGGHCIPRDPHYLLWQLRRLRVAAPVLESAMAAVALRPGRVVSRARELLAAQGRGLLGARILVLGVSYKPGVADLRESPALEVIAGLLSGGADVAYSDPLVPRLRCNDRELHSVEEPDQYWDLVVVHTLHPGTQLDWLGRQTDVLDATYRLEGVPHREVV